MCPGVVYNEDGSTIHIDGHNQIETVEFDGHPVQILNCPDGLYNLTTHTKYYDGDKRSSGGVTICATATPEERANLNIRSAPIEREKQTSL